MRDGVRLFTQVYRPLDASEPHPIIIMRSPYGIAPYGETFTNMTIPSLPYAKEGYIMVFQDIRGTSMSEGTFRFIRPHIPDKKTSADVDESSDAYDTVEWLLVNVPGHNGRVGFWGPSYAGFTAAMAALSGHPAVKAVSPQAPMADLFLGDDGHHYGALYLAHYANYVYSMGQVREKPGMDPRPRLRFPTPDGYAFYLQMGTLKNLSARIFGDTNPLWDETMAHETYDAYWKANSIYPHLHNIKPAILTVGGWYDAEDLLGTLRTYREIEQNNPGLPNTLVMGPWRHSGWSYFASPNENRGVFPFSGTIPYFMDKIELPFFNYHLKGKGAGNIPEAVVFETGTDQWRTYDAWPPAEAKEKKLFFAAEGCVSFDPPGVTGGRDDESAFDEYISDPAKPVPYTMQTSAQYYREYFVEDQRFAASRPDVLTYSGAVLAGDVTITGPIKAELYVSTTGTDADWVVKVIDVYPDNAPDPKTNPKGIRMGGYQRLIRGDIIRGKFRNSFEKPEPFVPGRVAKVEFELPDVQHTFLKGHRIMIQVQSSWFPLFDRNPQTFVNIRTAGEEDFRKATHRLHRTAEYPSGIRFKVLEK
ncbi:MAG: CocE/NonD family hydrolase [Candidatus Aminicenantes bacterium]|nr:CocE/NonD family hydrolase [Candidatus Aminicenantes bacterium]